MKFWDYSAKEWKPVEDNEELAKQSPLRTQDMYMWGYNNNKDNEEKGMIEPIRGQFIFWDDKLGVYREATWAEIGEGLFDNLFRWPKYE